MGLSGTQPGTHADPFAKTESPCDRGVTDGKVVAVYLWASCVFFLGWALLEANTHSARMTSVIRTLAGSSLVPFQQPSLAGTSLEIPLAGNEQKQMECVIHACDDNCFAC